MTFELRVYRRGRESPLAIKTTSLQQFLGAALILTTFGCGSTDFAGQSLSHQPTVAKAIDSISSSADSQVVKGPGQLGRDSEVSETFNLATAQNADAVDIIFLVDTSGSMSQEKRRLEQTMEEFIDTFLAKRKGIDYRLFLVGEDFRFPQGIGTNPRIDVVDAEIDSTDALDVAVALMNNSLRPQTLQTRANIRKELVVISDDNARGNSIDQIANSIDKGSLRLNAITGVKAFGNGSRCRIARVGKAYIDLAGRSSKPGLVQDLCDDDWGKLLANLGGTIIPAISASATLSSSIDQTKGVIVILDGTILSADQYELSYKDRLITIAPDLLNKSKGHVVIRYTPVTHA